MFFFFIFFAFLYDHFPNIWWVHLLLPKQPRNCNALWMGHGLLGPCLSFSFLDLCLDHFSKILNTADWEDPSTAAVWHKNVSKSLMFFASNINCNYKMFTCCLVYTICYSPFLLHLSVVFNIFWIIRQS